PPRELQQLWPRALETPPLRRLLARTSPPTRRVLRFYGVGESSVAEAFAAAGGDGDGIEVTICARDFETHVDLVVTPGAVSREVAQAMARGARTRLGVDVSVSVTGIAGPGGGTPEKPVGLVYLHAAGPGVEHAAELNFPGDRATIRMRATVAALHLVRK